MIKNIKTSFFPKKEIIIFLLFVLIVFVRYQFVKPSYKNGDSIRISKQVFSQIKKYSDYQGFFLNGLYVFLPLYPEIVYGDHVVIEGVVDLQKQRITKAKLIKVERPGGIYSLRSRLNGFFRKSLPEPHASLFAGLVLGTKEGMPESFWQKLKDTGTAHIVVASGTNVTLVAGFILSLTIGFISRKKAIVVSVFFIWIYAILSGFDAPVIRASVMVSFAYIGQLFGRVGNTKRILAITFFAMLIFNPLYIEDVGFWLSYASTSAIILFEPGIRKKLTNIPGIFREGFSTSLAAQIGVLPILYVTFGYISILSPIINAIILWSVPIMTSLGFISVLVSLISTGLARLILYLAYPLSLYFVYMVEVFS